MENYEPHDGSGILFGKLSFLQDTIEQLSACSEFEGEIVFCPGLKPFKEFDLQGKV